MMLRRTTQEIRRRLMNETRSFSVALNINEKFQEAWEAKRAGQS